MDAQKYIKSDDDIFAQNKYFEEEFVHNYNLLLNLSFCSLWGLNLLTLILRDGCTLSNELKIIGIEDCVAFKHSTWMTI